MADSTPSPCLIRCGLLVNSLRVAQASARLLGMVVECSRGTNRHFGLLTGLWRPPTLMSRRLGFHGTASPPLARNGGSVVDHRDPAPHRLGHLAGAHAGLFPGLQPLQQIL